MRVLFGPVEFPKLGAGKSKPGMPPPVPEGDTAAGGDGAEPVGAADGLSVADSTGEYVNIGPLLLVSSLVPFSLAATEVVTTAEGLPDDGVGGSLSTGVDLGLEGCDVETRVLASVVGGAVGVIREVDNIVRSSSVITGSPLVLWKVTPGMISVNTVSLIGSTTRAVSARTESSVVTELGSLIVELASIPK